ncbi:MAG: M28 family peptidase [Ignavibacteriaceae bacterium]
MKKSLLLAFGLILNGLLFPQIPAGYETGLKYIDKDDIQKNVSVLANDTMKGRPAGTLENYIACKYIAEKFSQFGLIPFVEPRSPRIKNVETNDDNDDDSKSPLFQQPKEELTPFDKYFQKFFILDSKIDPAKTSISLITKSERYSKVNTYSMKKDYVVDYKEMQGLNLTAQVVFLGYGIEKGEGEYSDYKDENGKEINIKERIVVFIEGYPQETDTSSSFNKVKNLSYKSTKKKVETLINKGALAVIVIANPLRNLPPFSVNYEGYAKSFEKSDHTLPGLKKKPTIPIIYADQKVVEDLFSASGKNLNKIVKEIDKTLKPTSFLVEDKTININLSYDNNLIPTQNVVGYIEGSDPILKNEYIVLGAHMDHIGLGYFGAMDRKDAGQIHNGADDNASGTAGIIELAEAFSKVKPKRSIIFIAFNGEEYGMLGSRYYAYLSPFKDLSKTVAMLNLDMISRNETDQVWLGGIFYGDDMKGVIEDVNKEVGMELFYNVGLLTFGSDQGPFIRMKIPSVFFFAGMHDEYHTPQDDVELLNFDKAYNIVKLAYLTAWSVANSDKKPAYRELNMDEKIKLVNDSLARQKKNKNKD